jgi:hypothetical protein
MPMSELRLIKRCAEFRPRKDADSIPHRTRGIYALLAAESKDRFNVVYVGMAGGPKAGVHGRVMAHKKKDWTHFSVYEVWDNISASEVAELEGLFRHIYRKDSRANHLNLQRRFNRLLKTRDNNFRRWK